MDGEIARRRALLVPTTKELAANPAFAALTCEAIFDVLKPAALACLAVDGPMGEVLVAQAESATYSMFKVRAQRCSCGHLLPPTLCLILSLCLSVLVRVLLFFVEIPSRSFCPEKADLDERTAGNGYDDGEADGTKGQLRRSQQHQQKQPQRGGGAGTTNPYGDDFGSEEEEGEEHNEPLPALLVPRAAMLEVGVACCRGEAAATAPTASLQAFHPCLRACPSPPCPAGCLLTPPPISVIAP